jgi:hypothetical protein
MFTSTVSNININYKTANHAIKFDIIFGEGREDTYGVSEKERKNFINNYDIEVFESGEGDNYAKGYRVVANEGPLVIKLENIYIQNENKCENLKYDYAIGFAVDNEAPEYYFDYSTLPINIKRDGTMWTIPANNSMDYNFDQNPNARFQWITKKALEEGYKPSDEELKLGMEESSQNTGLIYLTFMVFRKFKPEQVTRGATRSSSAARFGYGNEAKSASVKSEFEYATGTDKYILPIRLRISDNSPICNINCSQHLEGANLNVLRRQTMTVPF